MAYPSARPIGDFFTSVIRRDPHRLLDLLEVRRALEVHIAALAAQHASRGSVDAMELALDAMRHSPDDLDAVHAADVRFHESLATASGNQMLSFLIEAMEAPLHASRLQSLQGHLSRGGTVADVDRATCPDPGASAIARRQGRIGGDAGAPGRDGARPACRVRPRRHAGSGRR